MIKENTNWGDWLENAITGTIGFVLALIVGGFILIVCFGFVVGIIKFALSSIGIL